MRQKRLPKQASLAQANGRIPVGGRRTTVDELITLRILDGIYCWEFHAGK